MIKWLAFIFMIIDHIGLFFESTLSAEIYFYTRAIGRLSFPLFVYLLVKGFQRTSNLDKYLKRLFIFGIISEMIKRVFVPIISEQSLNIFFSMFLYGVFFKIIKSSRINKHKYKYVLLTLSTIGVILLSFLTEFSLLGLIIFIIILFLNESLTDYKQFIFISSTAIIQISGIILNVVHPTQLYSVLSGLLMFTSVDLLEQRIFNHSFEKWFFYIAYPLQWIVFGLIIGI